MESFDNNNNNEIIKEDKEKRVSLEECIEIGESVAKDMNLPMDRWAKETRKDFCEDVYYACLRSVNYNDELSYNHLGYAVRGNLASWYANAIRISIDAPHEWQSKTEVAIMNLFKSKYEQRKDEIKESINESSSNGLKEIPEDKMDELFDVDFTTTTYNDKPFWIFYDWSVLSEVSEILEPGAQKDKYDDSIILQYVSDYGFSDEWFVCDYLQEARPYINNMVYDYAILDGEIYSGDAIRMEKELQKAYIESLINNPKHANTIVDDNVIKGLGFNKVNEEEYEFGYYGRTDDNIKIYNDIKEKDKDAQVLFSVKEALPFSTSYDVWVKGVDNVDKKEENFLSEAITSKDIDNWCDTTEQEETLKLINRIAKRENIGLGFGTKVGKYPQSLIIDHGYQDNAIRIYPNGACKIKDKEFGSYKDEDLDIKVFEKDIIVAIKELSPKKEGSKDYSCTIVLREDDINELNELLGSTAERAWWDIEQVAFDEKCVFEDGTIGRLLIEIGDNDYEIVKGEYSLSCINGREYFTTLDEKHTIKFNREGKSYTINVVDGEPNEVDENRYERKAAIQSLKHANNSSKNESLQLIEGHENYDYKGFTIDLDDDQFHNIKRHGSGNVIVDIKIGDKVYATVNGYDAAEEWIDKNGQRILDEIKRQEEEQRKKDKQLNLKNSLKEVIAQYRQQLLEYVKIIKSGTNRFRDDSYTPSVENFIPVNEVDAKLFEQKIFINLDDLRESGKFISKDGTKEREAEELLLYDGLWGLSTYGGYIDTVMSFVPYIDAYKNREVDIMSIDGFVDSRCLGGWYTELSPEVESLFKAIQEQELQGVVKQDIEIHITDPVGIYLSSDDGCTVFSDISKDRNPSLSEMLTNDLIHYIEDNYDSLLNEYSQQKTTKNESLTSKSKQTLTEGRQVREYKGFELSMNDNALDMAEEEGEVGPSGLLVNIKFNGESLEIVKGFRRAREWVDRNYKPIVRKWVEDKEKEVKNVSNGVFVPHDHSTSSLVFDSDIYTLHGDDYEEKLPIIQKAIDKLIDSNVAPKDSEFYLQYTDDEGNLLEEDCILSDVYKNNLASLVEKKFNNSIENLLNEIEGASLWLCIFIESPFGEDVDILEEKLIQSSSKKALQQNIKTEIDSGKSPKQAAAIAYSIKNKNENVTNNDNQYGVHSYSQQSIIFRGTEEECAKFIEDNKLWDDAEIYTITPDDKHYIKEDKGNIKKEVPNFLWTDVCSNRLDKVKQYFEEHPNLINRRYNRFNMEHSLIMGALRNGNLEMVKLLKDLGETILDHEQKEYDDRLKEFEEYPQAIRSGSLDLLKDAIDVKSEDDITTDVVSESVGAKFEASYTFPKLTKEDEFKLLAYDLCVTDNSSKEDTEVSGKLDNIKRFAKEWLDYELVDDYLTINESYDDYEDDWEESNLYGGDLTYCPICNKKLVRDEDGDSYCPSCNDDAHSLSMKRRDLSKKESLELPKDGEFAFYKYENTAEWLIEKKYGEDVEYERLKVGKWYLNFKPEYIMIYEIDELGVYPVVITGEDKLEEFYTYEDAEEFYYDFLRDDEDEEELEESLGSKDDVIERATKLYVTKLNPYGFNNSPFDDEEEYIEALKDDLKVKEYAQHFINEFQDDNSEDAREFVSLLKELL